MQAVMSADFAIGQFRFLEPLLLVHGRWSYLRIARIVSYIFTKNQLIGLTIFFYNALCFFSGQIIYNGAALPHASQCPCWSCLHALLSKSSVGVPFILKF